VKIAQLRDWFNFVYIPSQTGDIQVTLSVCFVLQGRCFSCHGSNASECAVMGLRANEALSNALENGELTPGGKYFVTTGKDFPFCRKYI
jgi:hypothetical protein